MGRTLDRSKTTNKKCEHCVYWLSNTCTNEKSKHFGETTNYWIRCDGFRWETEEPEGNVTKLKRFLRDMRKNAESFKNNDYHTGYVSAVSTIEGFIACCEMEDYAHE